MADMYVVAAGGNWSVAATWESSKGAADAVGPPTTTTDVKFHDASGNVTVTAISYCKTLTQTVADVGNLIHPAGTYLRTYGDVTLVNARYVPSAGAVISNLAAATVTTGGNAMANYQGSGYKLTLGDDWTTLANKSCQMLISTNGLDLNGHAISGDSATNRLLVGTTTLGTARTITDSTGAMTTADFTHCDFQDITFTQTTSGNLDFQGDGVLAGDCGGNTQTGGGTLTLTTGLTVTWDVDASGNWSDVANWTNTGDDRVPLPQDNVVFDSSVTGNTITVDMPRIGADIDLTGGSGNTFNLTTSGLTYTVYGDLTIDESGDNFSCNKAFYFQSRTNATLTSGGASFGATVTVALPSTAGNNTLTLADAFSGTSLQTSNGVLTASAAVTLSVAYTGLSGTTTYGGPGFWTLNRASATVWTMLGDFQGDTSTIHIANGGSVFTGGTGVYYDIQVAPHANTLTFSGAFYVHDMTMSSAGTRTVKFTKGTEYHMTGNSFLAGTDGAPVTIQSTVDNPTVAGDMFTLHFGGAGYVSTDWLVIDGCITDAASNWYAGANSINGGNNGDSLTPPQPTWTFGPPPSGSLRRFNPRLYATGMNPGVM